MSVEVTARFGGTPLLALVVPADGAFRIGTAPGVDLPLLGFSCFPLVGEQGVIRIPAGVRARRCGTGPATSLADATTRLAPGERIELAIGSVELVLTEASPRVAVAPPPTDRRALPYALVALAAHLALWGTATALAAPRIPIRRPAQHALHARLAPRPPATPLPPALPVQRAHQTWISRTAPRPALAAPPPELAAPPPPATHQAAEAIGAARAQAMVGEHLGAALAALAGPANLRELVESTGSEYRAWEAAATGFGGASGHFDPAQRPGFGSIAAGRYQTIAHGHAVGDDYELPGLTDAPSGAVHICEGRGCIATGAIDRDAVTSWIRPHADELRACFAQAPADGGLVVSFTIDGQGAVQGVRARGAAAEPTACVAQVITAIAFPRTDKPTRVTYPIRFTRAG